MSTLYDIRILIVNVFSINIVLFTFISTIIFARAQSSNEIEAHPYTHSQDEHDLRYDLDQFKDLDLQSSNPSSDNHSTQNKAKKNLILLDDNLYLLDDDFDFGNNEFELQKLELDENDLENEKEYENFLNVFFNDSIHIGTKTSTSKAQTNGNFYRLNEKIKNLEFEKRTLNKKIENLEKQLQSANIKSGKVNDFEFEKRTLNKKIENLEKQLQSANSDKSFNNLKEEFDTLNKSSKPNRKTAYSFSSNGFGISAIVGGTIPILQDGFGVGPNIGIHLDTPASFTMAGMETKVGADLYTSIMSGDTWYFLHNIVGNISISPISSMEIRSGLGFTLATIGQTNQGSLSIPLDVIYYFPMDLSGFKIGLNLLSQLTFGHPGSQSTTSIINAGLIIKTPLRF